MSHAVATGVRSQPKVSASKLTEFVLDNVPLTALLGAALQASYTDWLEAMSDEARVILASGDPFDDRRIHALEACAASLRAIDSEENEVAHV